MRKLKGMTGGRIGIFAVILILIAIGIRMGAKAEEDLPLEERIEKLATEYISNYALEFQKDMKCSGLSDVRVEWSPCTKEEYMEGLKWKALYENYEVMEHNFYYKMNYYSDEIARIFQEKKEKGEKNELWKFLNELVIDRYRNRPASNDKIDHAKIYALDTEIGIYASDHMETDEIYFSTSDGHKYGMRRVKDGEEIYMDEEVLFFIDYGVKPGSGGKKKPLEDKKDSFYEKHQPTGEIYDAYDVEQYIDGDDFADEWADEFGDGDYDAGYEDAYDYWESESGY